jgi:hypothetical protein
VPLPCAVPLVDVVSAPLIVPAPVPTRDVVEGCCVERSLFEHAPTVMRALNSAAARTGIDVFMIASDVD